MINATVQSTSFPPQTHVQGLHVVKIQVIFIMVSQCVDLTCQTARLLCSNPLGGAWALPPTMHHRCKHSTAMFVS